MEGLLLGAGWMLASHLITFLSERSRGLQGSWGQGGRGLALTSRICLYKAMGWHSSPHNSHSLRLTLLRPEAMR